MGVARGPIFVGLDGFSGGWVAAWIDDRGNHGFDYSSALNRLLAMPHRRAMIDMPIGLPPAGYRTCDLRARELAGASVFLGARRNLWEFSDQAEANRYYWKHEGPRMGVSCQLWNIRDKIREVDGFVTPERQATVTEAHPELIFRRLSGPLSLEKKKSERGRDQRIGLLARQGFVQNFDLADSALGHRDRARRSDRCVRLRYRRAGQHLLPRQR